MQQLNGENVLCINLIDLEYPQPSYIFFLGQFHEFHTFIIYISGKFLSILFSAASRGECHDAHHINQTNLLKLNGSLY